MFDIGFSELLVLAVVALLVLGPERLPRAARFAGLWVRRARAQWYSVKSELESEFADDELKRSLQRTRDELRDVQDQL
ncbi:MAG: Sec-independent protein translocase protein TatB, partial [Burkholderiaceae bacterium]